MTTVERDEAEWRKAANWHGGPPGIHSSERDSRPFVPERGNPMAGATIDFARPILAMVLACTVAATSGCMRWQSVPPSDVTAQPPLPRWVRVTTHDSTHLLLERAQLRGDTLIGRAGDDAAAPLARIPMADVAHIEAREPSLGGSLGVMAVVFLGVAGFIIAIGYAART